MFITRRKFEEAIERAKRETEERMWQMQRIENIERNLYKAMDEMNTRLHKVEDFVFPPVKVDGCCICEPLNACPEPKGC